MKEFWINILTAGSGTSSKRLISLVGLMLLIIIILAGLVGIILPDIYLISVISLIGVNQGLTLFQKKEG